jgi:hypothetical protein
MDKCLFFVNNVEKRQMSEFHKEFSPILYLRAENTQEKIAEMVLGDSGLHKTVSNIVDSGKNGQMSFFTKEFSPILYNIWNTHGSRFGHDMVTPSLPEFWQRRIPSLIGHE